MEGSAEIVAYLRPAREFTVKVKKLSHEAPQALGQSLLWTWVHFIRCTGSKWPRNNLLQGDAVTKRGPEEAKTSITKIPHMTTTSTGLMDRLDLVPRGSCCHGQSKIQMWCAYVFQWPAVPHLFLLPYCIFQSLHLAYLGLVLPQRYLLLLVSSLQHHQIFLPIVFLMREEVGPVRGDAVLPTAILTTSVPVISTYNASDLCQIEQQNATLLNSWHGPYCLHHLAWHFSHFLHRKCEEEGWTKYFYSSFSSPLHLFLYSISLFLFKFREQEKWRRVVGGSRQPSQLYVWTGITIWGDTHILMHVFWLEEESAFLLMHIHSAKTKGSLTGWSWALMSPRQNSKVIGEWQTPNCLPESIHSAAFALGPSSWPCRVPQMRVFASVPLRKKNAQPWKYLRGKTTVMMSRDTCLILGKQEDILVQKFKGWGYKYMELTLME